MPVHGFPTFAAAAAAAAAAASIFIRIRMFMHINVHASCNLSNLACRGFIPHSDHVHDSDHRIRMRDVRPLFLSRQLI